MSSCKSSLCLERLRLCLGREKCGKAVGRRTVGRKDEGRKGWRQRMCGEQDGRRGKENGETDVGTVEKDTAPCCVSGWSIIKGIYYPVLFSPENSCGG